MIDEERVVGVAREKNLLLGMCMLKFGRAGAKNPRERHTWVCDGARKSLIKKVLPPLSIRSPDHPHNVPAGMEREWPRLLKKLHVSLSQQPIAFAPVTGMAACDQIFP